MRILFPFIPRYSHARQCKLLDDPTAINHPNPRILDIYYIAFPKDNTGIKTMVYGLFVIESAQTIMMMHDAVVVFGFGFGDPEELVKVHLAWFAVPILSCIVSSIVQSFFAW